VWEFNWSDGEFGGWNGRQMWELGGSEPCQGTSCPVCITECKVCAGREWKDGQPPSTSCGLDAIDTKFLGGPRCAGKDSTLFKKFDLSGVPHAKLLISFEYVYFNTWDGTQSSDGDEVARMTVVGGPVWTSTPKQHKTGEHIYAFDPKSNDECRHRESYGTERVEDWVVDHDGDEVTIEFGASLNQVVSDEAFGLSWFRLEAVAGPAPSSVPSATPSAAPTAVPSATPSAAPSDVASTAPTLIPSTAPSATPSVAPSTAPSATPSSGPSVAPSTAPSNGPSASPT
jgi:hypothetical protein